MTAEDGAETGGTRTVELPERTVEAVARRVAGTDFESVDEYVAVALEQLLRELDRQADRQDRDPDPDDRAGDATHDSVKNRLESLGYM